MSLLIQIGQKCIQSIFIIAQQAEAHITTTAKQSSYLASGVVMVNIKVKPYKRKE